MLNKRLNITFSVILLGIALNIIPVAAFGQTSVKYGEEIKKEPPVQYGAEIEKRPRVRYGVDIRVEDIRQVKPGEIVEEVVSDFEFDIRNYTKVSGYYDALDDDVVTNPDNVLELEDEGYHGEFNTQIRLSYLEEYQFSTDVGFQLSPGPGDQEDDDSHFVTNEFYFDFFLAQLAYLKVGKKRETWGVGYTFAPVQIIEFPKNLVDPYESREGNYLAMLEVPVGDASFSLIYFPYVYYDLETLQGESGIPNEIDYSDGREDYAARLSLLLWDTDISLIYYRADIIEGLQKNYFGTTLSRYFGDLGVYIEVEGHKGNDTEFLEEYAMEISEGNVYEYTAWPYGEELVDIKKADDDIYVNFAIGANYTFEDSTKISLEYYRNREGYSDNDWDYFYNEISGHAELYEELQEEMLAMKIFKTNDVLSDRIRRNYLSLTFDRPNTFDDFFPHLNALICLDDGSFMLNGTVDYAITDDITISLDMIGYVGDDDTEFGLKPDDFKATLRVEYYF